MRVFISHISPRTPVTRYFWTEGRIVIVDGHVPLADLARQFHNEPCLVVEPACARFMKYGYISWRLLPKSKIPKQLRVQALLLGVNTWEPS
jgi:hypothetical protein